MGDGGGCSACQLGCGWDARPASTVPPSPPYTMRFPKPLARRLERRREKRRQAALRAALRDKLTNRDQRCRVCQTLLSGAAHAHHLLFRSQGGTDSMENLLLVCPPCHTAIHARTIDLIPVDPVVGAEGVIEVQRRLG